MNLISYTTKLFAFMTLAAAVLIAATLPVAAQGKKNSRQPKQTKLWQQTDESRVKLLGSRSAMPEKYLIFRLDKASLQSSLAELPLENTDAARAKQTIMEIPQPDGTTERFRIEETQVLSPELAAQYPTWKTFVGYGIDNPQAVGRFDWNILGFHGYIEGGKGTVLIEPYQKGDTENYLVFYKHEYGTPDDEFSCKVKDDMLNIVESNYKPDFLPNASEFSFGATLRTYRIAIATTGEWSRNASGFDSNPTLTPQQIRDGAIAVVVTTLNRLIGIYIRELSSSFQLVNPPTSSANNIIFDNPNTDPYNNIDTDAELNANQSTLDMRVGTASYDIGHLYGTDGGGVASSPGLCRAGQGPANDPYPNNKAKGYSARGTNTGDPFTVDYVAHEIGHQFGAGHTYNNVDPSGTCTTRSANNAFEVASGATIMSYVGICGARNLQQFVDAGLPSFHIRSLTQIDNNIRTDAPSETPGCGPTSGTNAVPTVNAGASFNVPKLTPFTLTATGGDTDDPAANLLYSWEQYDLAPLGGSGTSGTPAGTYDVDTDGVQRPLFRVYSPVSSSSRVYPSLNFILNPQNNDATADVNGVRGNQPVLIYQGTHPTNAPGAVCKPGEECVIGERLPTINRTMNFRVSLRDRRGGVVDAGTTVTVAAGAGPFQVTTQNASPVSWQGGTPRTVTWDVAGTNANGINAANVNILLSTDGGQTFPITISSNTPNDGTELVTIPSVATTTARIRIQPTNNIFFDINNVNFTITAAVPATRAPFDFDGDGRTDISVFRPASGDWYINRSSAGVSVVRFGASTDLLTPADFDGDGKTDIAVFRPSNGVWYLINSSTNTFSGVQFGQNGDLPRPADFDGDNKADINVFRPSNGTWYRLNSTNGQFVFNAFGQTGDVPVAGDYDGDGRANLAVFRPSENRWYIARPTGTPAQNFDAINFGAAGDIPVPANYDGDTKTDVAVFRPSTGFWYRVNSSNAQSFAMQFGQNQDVPVAGDYDGDGRADLAVFRPSNGAWYSSNTQSGSPFIQFGATSDKPVPAAYVVGQ